MRRPFRSVRARTSLFATAVVAVALVAAGVAVVLALRSNLTSQTDLQAEVAARQVASQLATGTPYGRLKLPDHEDNPVQVVDDNEVVRAVSEDLRAITGTGTRTTKVTPSPTGTTPGRSDDDGDDHDEDDVKPPARGKVSGKAHHSTGTATVDDDTADYRFAAVAATSPAGETATVYAGAPLATQYDAVGTVVRSMLIGLPLLLAVVAGVTWLVTRRALRPVEAIRGELSAITGAGDLTRRVPQPASHDEVARLAATTNETLAALEASVEQQRRFVADASHELRSPIASLRTQLEVAAAHPELLDLDGAVADTVRLQHLAADLLLLARLDAEEQPQGTSVALDDLVREEVARRTDALPADVRIAGPARVRGSSRQLARVLGNLLDNAQRHAAGTVFVALRTEGADAVLEVADDGPGVPSAERERIFERFVRLDDARSRDDGGAGLGLAIARDVVRRHGGDIAVRQPPGGGAVFQVRLPADFP
ncbi:sensor histidine kinase [Streptomyces gilvosporeus]|uniref:histidine kinase n=1 Tax=Streptomyces gilvosporeus TaxID=553510 RepID=A0A1V0TZX8_9ACTN|nr:HAMP domain-containing sensor histidine kinase [Streptomyces gilvosporeus]ARF58483.1 two-component sensor histidine kinase [Streptomyces gilvosporeus]